MIIQLGHPKIIYVSKVSVQKLKQLFLHLFKSQDESIYLFINEQIIRLRYREDLFNNFDEILAMNWLLQKEERGAIKVNFVTQALFIHWRLFWEREQLTIKSKFKATEGMFEPFAKALNKSGDLEISKTAFLREWKTLLHQVLVVFEEANIQIEEGSEKRKLDMLKKVESQIKEYGLLYTN